jgi:hypothetical protein
MSATLNKKLRLLLVALLFTALTLWGSVDSARATTNEYVVTEIPNAPILVQSVIEYHGVTYTDGRDRNTGLNHMYSFDGTSFTEIPGSSGMSNPIIFNDKLIAIGTPPSSFDQHVYEFDGTTVRDLVNVGGLSSYDIFAIFNGNLYIGNNNSATNYETYKYSGSGNPTTFPNLPIGLETPVIYGNKIYARGWHAPGAYDLYSIDTSDTVTQITSDISPSMLSVVNNKLYYFGFIDYQVGYTRQLYSFDGTTSVVPNGGTFGSSPTTYSGNFYFVPNIDSSLKRIVNHQVDTVILSSSDGAIGTPTQIVPFDGRLFMRSSNGGYLESLWWSDISSTNRIPGLTNNLRIVGVAHNMLLVHTAFNVPSSSRLYAITNPNSVVPATNAPPAHVELAKTGGNYETFIGWAAALFVAGLILRVASRRNSTIRLTHPKL